jgi:hypothetical protein
MLETTDAADDDFTMMITVHRGVLDIEVLEVDWASLSIG